MVLEWSRITRNWKYLVVDETLVLHKKKSARLYGGRWRGRELADLPGVLVGQVQRVAGELDTTGLPALQKEGAGVAGNLPDEVGGNVLNHFVGLEVVGVARCVGAAVSHLLLSCTELGRRGHFQNAGRQTTLKRPSAGVSEVRPFCSSRRRTGEAQLAGDRRGMSLSGPGAKVAARIAFQPSAL